MLVERLSDALRNAAMLLAVDDHRIQHLPEIINHHVAVDRDLTGLRVDLDLDRMRAVRIAWRLGRMTAGAFEPDAESGHWPIGAKDAFATSTSGMASSVPATVKVPSLNSMSPTSASNIVADIAFALSMIASAARRSALPPTTALRSVGAAPELHLGSVALHIADLVERYAEEFMDELWEHCRVPLSVRVRAAEHQDPAKLDVIADRAAAQLAGLFRGRFALRVTLPVRHIDALVEPGHGNLINALVADEFDVTTCQDMANGV